MAKMENKLLERARNELMSHVVRCDVLESDMDQRVQWLDETMDYMSTRYPNLNDLEFAQLEMIGKQFIKPPIPHGADHGARYRDRNMEELVEEELATAV